VELLGTKSKSGGGKRKIGRAARKPAHVRYNNEMRWIKNKIKKAKKQAKIEAKKLNR
jgi:ribosomal protein L19E